MVSEPLALASALPCAMLRRLLLLPLRLLAGLARWLLMLILVFEEWGWEPLQALLARLGRWPGLRWIEGRVCALPPWAALTVFAVPTLLLLPVKLLALWAIGNGHVALGLAVLLLAKVLGTAAVARLFTLTRPALMQLEWFARGYTRWVGLKEKWLARVRASVLWRTARVVKRQARRRARWLWRAVRGI